MNRVNEQTLENQESLLSKLIADDQLEGTQVTEDGVRIGDTFFWCDHDCLGRYYQGSWKKAAAGDEDMDAENHACLISDVLEAYVKYQGAELEMMLKDLPEVTQKAVAAYWENKRNNCGFARYETLEEFAAVFNPLADELMNQRRLRFNSREFTQLQTICIDLFEYGDCRWPGKVYESGVPGVR